MPRPARVTLSPAARLVRAVLALAGRHARLIDHRERAWSSVTFTGARHHIVLRFTGWDACDDADHLIATLPGHAFAVPGLLVADASVVRTDETLVPERTLEVELELLVLDAD